MITFRGGNGRGAALSTGFSRIPMQHSGGSSVYTLDKSPSGGISGIPFELKRADVRSETDGKALVSCMRRNATSFGKLFGVIAATALLSAASAFGASTVGRAVLGIE